MIYRIHASSEFLVDYLTEGTTIGRGGLRIVEGLPRDAQLKHIGMKNVDGKDVLMIFATNEDRDLTLEDILVGIARGRVKDVDVMVTSEEIDPKNKSDVDIKGRPVRKPHTRTYEDEVGDMHFKLGLPLIDRDRSHELPDQDTVNYRIDFIREELGELEYAYEDRNKADILDALVDLVWVAIGTAHYLNLPFDAAWREVYRANLEKELADPNDESHKRGPMERTRKPEGWVPPDIDGVLSDHEDGGSK